jgi:hypothetical protein
MRKSRDLKLNIKSLNKLSPILNKKNEAHLKRQLLKEKFSKQRERDAEMLLKSITEENYQFSFQQSNQLEKLAVIKSAKINKKNGNSTNRSGSNTYLDRVHLSTSFNLDDDEVGDNSLYDLLNSSFTSLNKTLMNESLFMMPTTAATRQKPSLMAKTINSLEKKKLQEKKQEELLLENLKIRSMTKKTTQPSPIKKPLPKMKTTTTTLAAAKPRQIIRKTNTNRERKPKSYTDRLRESQSQFKNSTIIVPHSLAKYSKRDPMTTHNASSLRRSVVRKSKSLRKSRNYANELMDNDDDDDEINELLDGVDVQQCNDGCDECKIMELCSWNLDRKMENIIFSNGIKQQMQQKTKKNLLSRISFSDLNDISLPSSASAATYLDWNDIDNLIEQVEI